MQLRDTVFALLEEEIISDYLNSHLVLRYGLLSMHLQPATNLLLCCVVCLAY